MKRTAQQFVDMVTNIDDAHKEIAAFLSRRHENSNSISDSPSLDNISNALRDHSLRRTVQRVVSGVYDETDAEVFKYIAKDRIRSNYMDSPYKAEIVEIFEKIFDDLAKHIDKAGQE